MKLFDFLTKGFLKWEFLKLEMGILNGKSLKLLNTFDFLGVCLSITFFTSMNYRPTEIVPHVMQL